MPRKRYSYSFQSAMRFFPIYDNLLDIYHNPELGRATIDVPTNSFLGMSADTLANRIVDGLKWVAENFEEIDPEFNPKYGKADYGLLKINLKTSTHTDKVAMTLRVLKSTGFVVAVSGVPTPTGIEVAPIPDEPLTALEISSFRTEITNFLTNSKEIVKQFKNLHLTDGDMNWLKSILAGSSDLVESWEGNVLTIVKIKA